MARTIFPCYESRIGEWSGKSSGMRDAGDWDDDAVAGVADPISARLARPAGATELVDLPGVWFHAHVVTPFAPPRGWSAARLLTDPAMPGRLRGAWGRRLLEMASLPTRDERPCPWSPPCAYDPLFRERRALPGLEAPKPYVIALDPRPEGLVEARLTLFGFATDWLEAAAEAWVLALRGGIAMPDGLRAAVEPLDRRLVVVEDVEPTPPPIAAVLRFVTPLCLRRGGAVHGDVGALFSSLGNRVSGMARWMDRAVTADWAALRDHAAGLTIDARHMEPVSWTRYSARQGDRAIPMEGLSGPLAIAGDLAPIWPLLTLGATCHAGSHAAQGPGRYLLEPLAI